MKSLRVPSNELPHVPSSLRHYFLVFTTLLLIISNYFKGKKKYSFSKANFSPPTLDPIPFHLPLIWKNKNCTCIPPLPPWYFHFSIWKRTCPKQSEHVQTKILCFLPKSVPSQYLYHFHKQQYHCFNRPGHKHCSDPWLSFFPLSNLTSNTSKSSWLFIFKMHLSLSLLISITTLWVQDTIIFHLDYGNDLPTIFSASILAFYASFSHSNHGEPI